MFENEYTMNRTFIKEYVFNIVGKNSMMMGVFLFILGSVMYYVSSDSLKYAMLACSFIGIFCAIMTPIVLIKNFEETAKRINNGNIEKTKVTFGENIKMDEGKVHLEFEYSQIQSIVETNNFIVLKIGKNASILVLKEGFTKGNKEDFIVFINNKINEFKLER